MNPFWKKIITLFILNPKQKERDEDKTYSSYDMAKGMVELKRASRDLVTDIFQIVVGIISAGFGLKGFLLPNGFIDGGATGISLLVTNLTDIPLPILLVLINIPFLVLGLSAFGTGFVVRAVLAIIGLAVVVAFVPYPEITNDKLLIAVFGGFFLGAGIGMTVRGGAVIDGTEVLAISTSRQAGLSIGDIIMIINIIIFMFAANLISNETALYAMLTYLAASKTVE